MSTFLRWFLVLLAISTVVMLGQLWIEGESRTGASMLASARERWRDKLPFEADFDGALRELELALGLARQAGETELEREIRVERARLHHMRENDDLALEECSILLNAYEANDREVLLLAAQSALGAGHPSETLLYAARLLGIEPGNPDVHVYVGQAEAQLAELALADLDYELNEGLADINARAAAQASRRAAAHPPGTPQRHAALEKLYSYLPSSDLNQNAVEAVDEASHHLLSATAAFVERLRYAPDGHAIAGLQAILLRAGSTQEAIDLGTLALRLDELTWRTTVLVRTALALDAVDRSREARDLIAEVQRTIKGGFLKPRSLSDRELYEWCRLLHRLELWSELIDSAQVLGRRLDKLEMRDPETAARSELAGIGQFFLGVARSNRRAARPARVNLKNYQEKSTREAFPGITLQMWLASANAARMLGRGPQERYALLQATKQLTYEIGDPLLAEVAGEAWLRLGEFQMSENNALGAERSFAHAMRLLPRQRTKIQMLWEQAGLRGAEVRGNQKSLADHTAQAAPHEVWIKSKKRMAEGSYEEAVFLAGRLLDYYPGLPAALEVQAQAEFEREHYEHAIEALLELAEKGFYQPQELQLLREIPYEAFRGEELVRWMLFDPRSAGLVSVARELERSGRTSLALQALRVQSPRRMRSDELAFFVRLLAKAGEWEACGDLLRFIPPEDPAFSETAVLAIRAAFNVREEVSEEDLLLRTIQGRANFIPNQDPDLPGTIDLLLAAGEVGAARTVLESVDARPDDKDPGVLMRLAVVHTVQRHLADAEEALERCEPFFDADEAGLGWLLMAADARDYERLEAVTGDLFQGPFVSDAFRHALLTSLENPPIGLRRLHQIEGREDDPRMLFAMRVVEATLAAEGVLLEEEGEETGVPPADDPWTKVDGRSLLPLVLAMESRPWCAWTIGRIGELPDALKESPEARLLGIACLVELGALDRAEVQLAALTREQPDLRPAWVLRERIALQRSGSWESDDHLDVFLERLEAVGPMETPPQEVALARAFDARRNERIDEARSILEDALVVVPDDLSLRLELARLLSVPGSRVRAIEEFDHLFATQAPDAIRPVLPEALDVLRTARIDGEISEGVWWAELEALESQYPDEPTVARELAERTIESAAEGRLDWGVQQAWGHLDRFRQRTRFVPIESLRAGEAERWTKLFRRHDPDRAVDFSYAELTANPSSPELWRAWCESLGAAGRRQEALRAYKAILAVVPEPQLLKSFALLQADRLDDPRAIRASLGGVELFLDRESTDPDLVFRRGLSLLGGTEGGRRRGLQDMRSVWTNRRSNGIDASQLGRRFAITLYDEGLSAVAQNVLREAYLEETDPLQESVLRATAHLIRLKPAVSPKAAARQERRNPPPGEEPEEAEDAGEDARQATGDVDPAEGVETVQATKGD